MISQIPMLSKVEVALDQLPLYFGAIPQCLFQLAYF